jgi:hypothetical protein
LLISASDVYSRPTLPSSRAQSITAGWFIGGLRPIQKETIHEYRGLSYAAGGDEGAVTIPNVRQTLP